MESTRSHESYIEAVRKAVLETAQIPEELAVKVQHSKLVYGIGNGSYRGVCHYQAWENGIGTVDVIEVAATAEESWIQLAGTTIHELGHVIAGFEAGHGPAWKVSCDLLGLRRATVGQVYRLANLAPAIRSSVYTLAQEIGDGSPAFRTAGLGAAGGIGLQILRGLRRGPRPCSAGIGSRGGKSRGPGSGSRQRKYVCQGCEPAQIIRAATDELEATHVVCLTRFVQVAPKGGEAE